MRENRQKQEAAPPRNLREIIQFYLIDCKTPVGKLIDIFIIVLNLVQNALEAMTDAEEKHLTIETSAEEDGVIIMVQDTGCGIPEEDLDGIYRICFTTKRGDENQGKAEDHAGVGLSIVSLLIKDYGGSISCSSHRGSTTFAVRIPCHSPSP